MSASDGWWLFLGVAIWALVTGPLLHQGVRRGRGVSDASWRRARGYAVWVGLVVVVLVVLPMPYVSDAVLIGSLIGSAMGWALMCVLAYWVGIGIGRAWSWHLIRRQPPPAQVQMPSARPRASTVPRVRQVPHARRVPPPE